ncbi:MAG: sugar phosphate nucleotidyltransferase [Gemmobacter sp.]
MKEHRIQKTEARASRTPQILDHVPASEALVPNTPIRTVIIPAAGKGTRLLPATFVTAKELLPIYDRVVLDFAIDEAVELGADRIVIVISTAKVAIQTYLNGHGLPGRNSGASVIGRPGTTVPELIFVAQNSPCGLGHAVLCCKEATLPGPFAVLLPDDIIFGPNCLAEMAAHYTGGHMVAAMQVNPEDASQYGIFRLAGLPKGSCMSVSGMVEKPSPSHAPSSIAAVGRYILDPAIFEVLERTPYGRGGELQLTDAITTSADAMPVVAFRFSGNRHDCGNRDGLLAASVARKAAVRRQSANVGKSASIFDTPSDDIGAIVRKVKAPDQHMSPVHLPNSVDTM